MPDSHVWMVVTTFTLFIGFYLLYLYFRNKDKRKLIFSIALFIGAISYVGLTLGYISFDTGGMSVLWFNIFSLSSLPLMVALFIAANEPLLKIKNFDNFFYLFLVICLSTFVLFFIPYRLEVFPNLVRMIISIEVLAVVSYLFYKTREIENLYFILYIFSSIISGRSFGLEFSYLASFSTLTSYIFLTLIFVKSSKSSKHSKKSVKSYFSIEEKLKTTEKKYRHLFNTIPDAIALLSEDGEILDINDSMASNFNATKEDMIGRKMQDILPENVSKKRGKIGIKALKTGEIQENEDKRGESYFHNMYVPIETNKKQKNLMVIARDVTNEKKMEIEREKKLKELRDTELATLNIMEDMQETVENLEEAKKEISEKNEEMRMTNTELNVAREQLTDLNENLEQKVEERTKEVRKLIKQKDDFINQLGHDLKTPLTPLNTLLPIVKDSVEDKKSKELLNVSIQNVQYMKNLVIKTLKLARLNSSNIELNKKKVNLQDEINKVLDNHIFDFEKNQIKIENNVDKEIFMDADPTRLKELFDNLISNAVKYNTKGGEIKIDALTDDDKVKIRIQDTGQGMTKDQAEHIFDEFYKADESRHDFESSGLGLSICKKIVEKHGGNIWAESAGLDKGSTFYISFKNRIKEKTIK